MKNIKKIYILLIAGFLLLSTFTIADSRLNNDSNNHNESNYENIDHCFLLDQEFPVMSDKPPMKDIYFQIPEYDEDPIPSRSLDTIPSQFSWKSYGGDWTTPARDQGNCGSCYIFGPIGCFEGAINLASGYPDTDIDLSEQYCLSCVNAGNYGCNGGLGNTIIDAIQSTEMGQYGNSINGCPTESCMPYQANDNIPCSDKCDNWNYYTSPPGSDNILWQIDTWGWTNSFSEDNPSDWDTIKTWLLDHGPLCIDIYVGGFGSWGNSHNSPTDVYENDDPGYTNHEITLVGWADDPEITNGGYWIIKNSWGASWGYGGFANIAYGCNSLGEDIVCWVDAFDWPPEQQGPGPVDVDIAVFSNFDYKTKDGIQYAHPGDEITFTDTSDGDVALREWDFDGDGVIDSNKKMPTYTYENEGEYKVTLTVYSEWGLHTNLSKIVEIKEFWPPKAVINYDEFILHDTLVCDSFDARWSYDRDGGTIVDYHWDFGDGSTDEGTNPDHEFPSYDRIYDVVLTITDDDGASESTTCQVKIDQTKTPITDILHRGCVKLNDWYSETQRIYFSATDWTSVVDTYYRIDGGSWIRYIPEEQEYIPVGSEGEHTIEAYSIDYWGNEETPVVDTFSIDKTEPTVFVNINGANQENGWFTDDVTVTINADDDFSGIDIITYKLDSNIWNTYTDGFIVGNGGHHLWVVAVDKAGNLGEEEFIINVDTDNPKTNIILVGQGSDNRFYQSVEMRLAASDTGSGVKEIYYNLDDDPGGFRVYYQPMIIDEIGTHTIEYYSIDNIGNIGETKTETFTISNVNFDLHITEPENALYIFGIKLIPTSQPILIGKGTVTVNAEPFTTDPANIQQIEIQLDGETQITTTQSIYTWRIDQSLMGKHTITIKATTNNEETITKEITPIFLIF